MPKQTKLPKRCKSLIRAASIASWRLRHALEGEQIYVSNIPLSLVCFMYLSKAFHVHEAVLVLCKAGFGSEAYALSRVLVEMWVAVRWITNQDQNDRAKQYGFFVAKRKQYWAQIIKKYDPTSPQSDEAVKYAEKLYGKYAAQYSSFTFWANVPVNLKGMASEPEILQRSSMAEKAVLWDYEVPYSMASDHVHATASALDSLVPVIGSPYKPSRIVDPNLIDNATFTATAWLFKIVLRIDAAQTLGLQDEIERAWKPFAGRIR